MDPPPRAVRNRSSHIGRQCYGLLNGLAFVSVVRRQDKRTEVSVQVFISSASFRGPWETGEQAVTTEYSDLANWVTERKSKVRAGAVES